MVEFAIVAPLLLVLLFGIIEFGCILYDQAVITNASREGARYAAMYTGNISQSQNIVNYVQTYAANNLISFGNSSVAVNANRYSGSGVGYYWQVQVSYPYNFLVFGSLITLINGSITNPWTLGATTVMRDEYQS